MRHASISTTMAYYVDLQADDISGDLWRQFGPEFNTSFNSGHSEALSEDGTSNGEDAETSVV